MLPPKWRLRAFRAGDLTSVFVPSAQHEALRDLVRAREAAKTEERSTMAWAAYLIEDASRSSMLSGRSLCSSALA